MAQTFKDILDTPRTDDQGVMGIKNNGEMNYLDDTGDHNITWDRTKPVEVEMARKTFDEWKKRKQGYQPFNVRADGERGEQITEFDPRAEAIIFAPSLQGG